MAAFNAHRWHVRRSLVVGVLIVLGALAALELTTDWFLLTAPSKDIWLHCKHFELRQKPGTVDMVANRVFIVTQDSQTDACATSAFVCVEWLRAETATGTRRVFITSEPSPNDSGQTSSLGDLLLIGDLRYGNNLFHMLNDNILPLFIVAHLLFGRPIGTDMLERLRLATLVEFERRWHNNKVSSSIEVASWLGLPPIDTFASLADGILPNEYFEIVLFPNYIGHTIQTITAQAITV